jgi:hypothetical protein
MHTSDNKLKEIYTCGSMRTVRDQQMKLKKKLLFL